MLSSQPTSYHNLEYTSINGHCCYTSGQGQAATPFSVRDILNLAEQCSDDSTNLLEASLFQQDDTTRTNTNCGYDNCNSIVQDATYTCSWNDFQQPCQSEQFYCEQTFSANRTTNQWETISPTIASQTSNQQVVSGMTSQHVQHLSHLTPPFIDTEVSHASKSFTRYLILN